MEGQLVSDEHKIKLRYLLDYKFNKYHRFLQKFLQFVILFSLVSFLLSNYWYSFSSLVHSFNLYYATFLLPVFTHTLERKYMFLICNGILAFVTKSSGSFHSSNSPMNNSQHGGDGEFLKTNNGDGMSSEMENALRKTMELEDPVVGKDEAAWRSNGFLETNPIVEEDDDQEQEQEQEQEEQEQEEQEEADQSFTATEEDDKGEEGSWIGEREEREVENEELLSTDELKKKFDDFIRRMREELRIEARKQLKVA